jgi:hypothetical protein
MVLMFYFLVAAVAVTGASAIIGVFLTNLIIDRFTTSDRAKKETPSTHRRGRFECFSRHQTQARLAGVLIRRR